MVARAEKEEEKTDFKRSIGTFLSKCFFKKLAYSYTTVHICQDLSGEFYYVQNKPFLYLFITKEQSENEYKVKIMF